MSEADAMQALPAIAGAAGGGLGVLWLARTLFARMIREYDERHKTQADKLEKTADKFDKALEALRESLGELRSKVAVVEVMLADTKALRADVQTAVSAVGHSLAELRARLETRVDTAAAEVAELKGDVWVAHRRIELVARGDNDISSVTKPKSKRG